MSSSTSSSTSSSVSLPLTTATTKTTTTAITINKKKNQQQPKQRRQILTEEDYTETLERIVQRDYFPDVPELETQIALLDKRAVGDVAGAVAVRRAARQIKQHEESLQELELQQEQELTTASSSSSSSRRIVPRPLHRETITGFHTRVTSEDNYHFDQTQKKELKQQRQTLKQVFDNSNSSSQQQHQQAAAAVTRTPFLLASDKFNPTSNQLEITTTTSSSQPQNPRNNGLFFSPSREPTEQDNNNETKLLLPHSAVPTTASAAAASLMPPPPPMNAMSKSNTSKTGETSTTLSIATVSNGPSHNHQLVEYVPKSSIVKRIEPSQTRFPPTTKRNHYSNQQHFQREDDNASLFSSATTTTDDNASYTTTDLDDDTPQRSIHAERQARIKRYKREQETLVQMTPLIEPGKTRHTIKSVVKNTIHNNDDDPDHGSPIITWGTVASTPMVLGGGTGTPAASTIPVGDDDSYSFRLPHTNSREEAVYQKMEDEKERQQQRRRQQKKQREKQKYNQSNSTPTVTSLDRSIANLTPAARSLFERTIVNSTSISKSTGNRSKLISSRSKDAFASALRSSYSSSTPQKRGHYTPKGTSSRRSSSSRKRHLASKATPLLTSMDTTTKANIKSNSIRNNNKATTATTNRVSQRDPCISTTSKKGNMTDDLLHLPNRNT